MDLQLKDKVVLITGGTGGIGAGLVQTFLDEGAKVAFSSTRQEKVDALLPTLEGDAANVRGFVLDATDEEAVKNFVEEARAHFGGLDIIVPNAGYEGKSRLIQDVDMAEVEKTYAINVFSPMYMMKYAVPYLVEQGSGSIVIIASAASYTPTATMSTYVSSKYAVEGLAKCVAQEVGPAGINVNLICPGPVDTEMMIRIEQDMFHGEMTHEQAMEIIASTALDKRYATVKEVADATVFLASPLSKHTTGMLFHLDDLVTSF